MRWVLVVLSLVFISSHVAIAAEAVKKAPVVKAATAVPKTAITNTAKAPPAAAKSVDAAKSKKLDPQINIIELEKKYGFSMKDADEGALLPDYPKNAVVSVGKEQKYKIDEEDTMIDIARAFDLGYVETVAANQGIDPWTPVPGDELTIPSFKLLPRAKQEGLVVNLGQMRLYYFKPVAGGKTEIITFPIGIGREGLNTPQGETSIINKRANPIWAPTARMREEKKWLPVAVHAGPSNPLGEYAMYLGWPTFLIHGSNKPWAIGRRVSSGCMRMYPEDIKALFEMVPVGTKVTVVNQPLLVAEIGGKFYLEANPSKTQGNDIEVNGSHVIEKMDPRVKHVIEVAAGKKAATIDWKRVEDALALRAGYPVVISFTKDAPKAQRAKYRRTEPTARREFRSNND